MDSAPCLQIQALSKQYAGPQGRRVLDGLDLQLAAGEYVAIMGASGSGKSTLLNVLGGLLRADSGTIRLEGVPMHNLDDAGLTRLRRRRIGFVFQAFHLLPHLSACMNIALPLQLDGVPRGQALARARALLEQVALGERADALPGELSGGEVQRVAVARALAHEPALVLADEPTGNLDTHSADEIFELLQTINRERQSACLIVTHDPRLAARCQRQIRIVDGQLS